MHIGELIRARRLHYGMSQAELARRVTLSTQAMNDLEQGKTQEPRFSTVYKIAQALKTSLDELTKGVHV